MDAPRRPDLKTALALTVFVTPLLAACGGETLTSERRSISRTFETIPSSPRGDDGGVTGDPHAALCRPCRQDASCAGGVCRSYGPEGSFCASRCDVETACPEGFSCIAGGCVRDEGPCACEEAFEGAITACTFEAAGTTCRGTRSCEGGTFSRCTPNEDAPLVCSDEGDDCSGITAPEDLARVGQPCDGPDDDLCEDGVWICRGTTLFCTDDPTVSRVELCNGIDDNCNGLTDELWPLLGTPCDGPDDDFCEDGTIVCDPDDPTGLICDEDMEARVEECNGQDDDCNGLTDDGIDCPPDSSRVCYPGTAFDWDVCYDLVSVNTVTDPAYDYPVSTDPRYAPPNYLLDLQGLNGSTRLALNFTLNEFMETSKGRYGVLRPLTVAHFQRIRAALGVALWVNSGFRSPGYNAGVEGAAQFSRHMYGDAADVTAQGATSLANIALACNAEGADFVLTYATHVHCDWRDEPHTNDFWWTPPQPRSLLGQNLGDEAREALDPWELLWADVDVEVLNEDEARLSARWGDAFDEGTPWVSWELRSEEVGASELIEPELSIIVARGTHVRWRIGGILEGQLRVP